MQKPTIKKHLKNYLDILRNQNTKDSYSFAFRIIIKNRILKPLLKIEEFSLLNINAMLDKIKKIDGYSESTKQQFAAAFISFTKYLNRATQGKTPIAIPDRHGVNKTFYRVRDKVKTEAVSLVEIKKFLVELKKSNPQHALIAEIAYSGIKRISEVLRLKVEDLDQPEITFTQSKTRGTDKKTVITYKDEIFDNLSSYILERQTGFVFIKNGLPIHRLQIYYSFVNISHRLKLHITPHVLRASAITQYKKLGHSAEDIGALSGTTEEMVKKYDKRGLADNISKTNPLL